MFHYADLTQVYWLYVNQIILYFVCFLWLCKLHGSAKHTFIELFNVPNSVLTIVLCDVIVLIWISPHSPLVRYWYPHCPMRGQVTFSRLGSQQQSLDSHSDPMISNPESPKCHHLTLCVRTFLDHRRDRALLFLRGEWKNIKAGCPHIWKWARDTARLAKAASRSAFAKPYLFRLWTASPSELDLHTSTSESVHIADDVLLWYLSNVKNQLRPWTQKAWGPLCEAGRPPKGKGFALFFCPQHLTRWAWSSGHSAVGAPCHLSTWDHHQQSSLKYSKC